MKVRLYRKLLKAVEKNLEVCYIRAENSYFVYLYSDKKHKSGAAILHKFKHADNIVMFMRSYNDESEWRFKALHEIKCNSKCIKKAAFKYLFDNYKDNNCIKHNINFKF